MNSQQPLWWQRFFWRTAGGLIFIAVVSEPDAAECASWSAAENAWLFRLGCAAVCALLSLSINASTASAETLRITPAPRSPYEPEPPFDAGIEEKPRIDLRMVAGFALAALIESLLFGKSKLAAPLGSPQNIAGWLDILISTVFWGMLGGAFSRRPRRTEDAAMIEHAEEHPPARPPETKPKRGIDRMRWIMFALFFTVCFAVSLWAHGGNLHFGRTWFGALEYWGKLLFMSFGLAFFWAPIPATYSSGEPELLRVTPARPNPPPVI
jgi:hypothetical protein